MLGDFEKELYEFVENKHPDIFSELKEKEAIDDSLDKKMSSAIGGFVTEFKANRNL